MKNVKSNVGPKAALTSGPRNCPSKLYTRGELSPGPGLGSTQVKYIYCNGQDPYLIETEVTLELGLFGTLKLVLALQFIVTNTYFSVARTLTLVLHATLK